MLNGIIYWNVYNNLFVSIYILLKVQVKHNCLGARVAQWVIIRIRIRIRKLYFDSAHNKTVQHKL